MSWWLDRIYGHDRRLDKLERKVNAQAFMLATVSNDNVTLKEQVAQLVASVAMLEVNVGDLTVRVRALEAEIPVDKRAVLWSVGVPEGEA